MLNKYLIPAAIRLELSGTKNDAIREAVDALTKELKLNADDIYDAVMDREKVIATGMGHGVALPHAKIKGLKDFALSVCRSKSPIDYGAVDGVPVRILVLLLTPEERARDHVKIIAELNKKMKFAGFRQTILDAKTPKNLAEVFATPR